MSTRSEPAGDTCGNNHPRTAENTYRNPVTGERKCKVCQREQRPPQPSRAKKPKPPIDPDVIAALRAAAGIQTREDASR